MRFLVTLPVALLSFSQETLEGGSCGYRVSIRERHISLFTLAPTRSLLGAMIMLIINAARMVIRLLKKQFMKIKTGTKLEDGSVVTCFAHVGLSYTYMQGSGLGLLSAGLNFAYYCKDSLVGQARRIFVALRLPSGEEILLLLKVPGDDLDPESLEGESEEAKQKVAGLIDASFSGCWGLKPPTPETTLVESLGGSTFRLKPSNMALRAAALSAVTGGGDDGDGRGIIGSRRPQLHFDLTINDNDDAKTWFTAHQCLR